MIQQLAIVGATGAVGREVCTILDQRRVPVQRVSLYASSKSAGIKIRVRGVEHIVQEVTEQSLTGMNVAIFSAGAERSRKWVPHVVRQGAIAIDNSSAFRMQPDVPLVIPEINPEDLRTHRGIIAVANCSAILLCMVIGPLQKAFGIRRIVVSTYQAVSGAGAAAMQELRSQTAEVLADRAARPAVFPHQIAFNLFSHNTPIGDDGYNVEESKVIEETRKILHAPEMLITATCIRVPVFRAHSESVNLTFDRSVSANDVREVLGASAGVCVVDDPRRNHFPMPVEASGQDDVFVGRIRQDQSQKDGRGIDLFLSGDQLRKGAALNALQIVEALAGLDP